MSIRIVVLVALMAASCATSANSETECEANYKKTGSFVAGQQFSTWASIPDVTPEVAFERIYLGGTKVGLKVAKLDKEAGTILFDQARSGVDVEGAVVSTLWNVIIETDGKGSKISVTKTTPAKYATSESYQIQGMCSAINVARNAP